MPTDSILPASPPLMAWRRRDSVRIGPLAISICVGALLVHGILATLLALRSDGTYMDDELRHYLVARAARHGLRYLLDVWGRPGFTVLFAPAANLGDLPLGFMATRLMTVLVVLVAGALTYFTARRMRAPLPWLAPVLLLLMPMWLALSYTPTTETAAAFYTIAGTWQLARGNRRTAAICFALLPLTRHEMVVLLLPVAFYLLFRRDFFSVLLLGWAEAVWNLLAVIADMPAPLLRFFSHLEQGNLGSGNGLHYFNRWLEMSGIGGVALVLAGGLVIALREIPRCRRWMTTAPAGRRLRLRLLVSVGAISLVALHSTLYQFNRFASGGYARFLIPAAPWMAITSLYAIDAAIRRRRFVLRAAGMLVVAVIVASCFSGSWVSVATVWRVLAAVAVALLLVHRRRWTIGIAGAAMAALAIAQLAGEIHPYRINWQQETVRNVLVAIREQMPRSRVVGASPWVPYFQGKSLEEAEIDARRRWEQNEPAGVLYLYDMSHATAVPYDWFTRFPHAVLFSSPVKADGETPYVRVLKRYPGSVERP